MRLGIWWSMLRGHWCRKHGARKVKIFTSVNDPGEYEWVCGWCDEEATVERLKAQANGYVFRI